MKRKLSISIDEETLLGMMDTIRSKRFRNKSHIVEYAVTRLLNDLEVKK